jgi:hypothetical protein
MPAKAEAMDQAIERKNKSEDRAEGRGVWMRAAGSQGARRMSKWENNPNLRLRPAKPALGRGRIQRQIRRAFLANDAKPLTSSEIYRWVYPRKERYGWLDRWSVLLALRSLGALRMGRAKTPGHPWLWKLPTPRQPLGEDSPQPAIEIIGESEIPAILPTSLSTWKMGNRHWWVLRLILFLQQ